VRRASPTRWHVSKLDELHALGFDLSYISMGTVNGVLYPRCSQCHALVVNGVATHESGCVNALHECTGCNALVPMNQRYCEDCQ
jgi:hypothetical protein